MARTVIVGDMHARLDCSRELLELVGVIRRHPTDPALDERDESVHFIQLGDTVSLGYGEREARFCRWLFETVGVDEALIGNHELPAVWWDPEAVMFRGWHDLDELDDERAAGYDWPVGRDREAVRLVRERFARGGYRVATAVGDWLVTHAGLAAVHEQEHDLVGASAREASDYLNGLFDACMAERRSSPVIEDRTPHAGGIAWLRHEHLAAEYDRAAVTRPQVIGHSGYAGPGLHAGLLWNIDTPPLSELASTRSDNGGVAALVTDDGGATLTLVVVSSSSE